MADLNSLLALLDRRPDYAPLLARMVELEEAEAERRRHPELLDEWERSAPSGANGLPRYWGIERKQLGARPGWMDELAYEGVVELLGMTRSHAPYQLTDRELVQRALCAWTPVAVAEDEGPEEVAGDLFAPIVGHEQVKRLLKLAIAAPRPVHVLLTGDEPGTAKTLFLEELRRGLPRALYADGALATRAGIVEALLSRAPQYLLLDQADSLTPRDQLALLGVMAHGRVARLRYREHQDERRLTWVFASANDPAYLSRPLLDRFQAMWFRPYTDVEFVEVCRRFLAKREGVDPELASYIAGALVPRTRSIRDAQRIARLARSVGEVDELLGILTFSDERGEREGAWSPGRRSARSS